MLKHKILKFIFSVVLYLCSSNTSARVIKVEKNKFKDEMEGKIIGGKPIPLKVVPSSIQIFNQGSMCAGTILNSWTILTAAHCFDFNKNVEEMVVQIGSRYVYDFNAKQYTVDSLQIHDKYNRTGPFAVDIALMFLEDAIEFGEDTKKAVIVNHDNWMSPKERNFTVSGWGWTKYGGSISKDGLMMARLRFVSKNECSRLHKMRLTDDMFCLYGDGTRDTCKGDSGGGVFWNGMIVGITSHGDGCAKKQKPSVYTNVFYFREWIRDQILNYITEYCQNIKED